jgi:asparagine synthase (glutamine-hydrolysing)
MCGIVGFIDFNKKSDYDILKNMTDILYHRGPDDSGYSFYRLEKSNIGLGHRRLSILDLSVQGHQPMKFDNLEIVYNGEVYNFKEIRVELEKYGYSFKSNSDTEVIIKAYHKWGIEAVHKFNGMFAFAIFDKREEKLILIRDRAGVKPLYWYFNDNLFLFGSELKAFYQHPLFQKEVLNSSVALYLQYGYIPQPYTIFKNTYKLENGSFLIFALKNKRIKKEKYWDIYQVYDKPKLQLHENEALNELDKIINQSIKYRMISDVPFGSFLSGGYDSSLVTSIMQKNSISKIKTFTIGFDSKKYDESAYAKKVADYLGTEHTTYIATAKDALEIFPKLPYIYDEPIADDSVIPTLIVSKITRQSVIVSLSADGGDELFGGYSGYIKSLNVYNVFKKLPFKQQVGCLLQFSRYFSKNDKINRRLSRILSLLKGQTVLDIYKTFSNIFLENDVKRLLKNTSDLSISNLKLLDDNIDLLLANDFQTSQLDKLLVKVDRATMYYSLEGREPLLDYNLIEFVAKLPSEYKIKNNQGKYLLKKLTHKYIPKEIMQRPKMGFSIPIKEWLQSSFDEYVKYYFDESKIIKQDIFNLEEINKIKNNYLQNKDINMRQLWSLLIFQVWWEKWNS